MIHVAASPRLVSPRKCPHGTRGVAASGYGRGANGRTPAQVARAGPSGPAFGRYDDTDGARTAAEALAAAETAFPSTCGHCGANDGCRVLYAAVCSQHSSYSLSHYQWVVEYELYCVACELRGGRPYTHRVNATSHGMPAAQKYIARDFHGVGD